MTSTASAEPSGAVVTQKHVFFGVSALLFAASALITIAWSTSMSAMGEMLMPGDWTMSMTWMRMPGQTWPGVAAIVPRHVGRDDGGDDAAVSRPNAVELSQGSRQGAHERRPGWRTALVGVGYFFVWTRVRSGRLSVRCRAYGDRDATARALARGAARDRGRHSDRGCVAVHRMEGASARRLP